MPESGVATPRTSRPTRGAASILGSSGSAWRLGVRSRAQSVMELALVAPILLLLVVGIVELGRLVSLRITVDSAAREGAYLAATRLAGDTSDQEIREAASRETSGSGILPDAVHVTVAYPSPDIVQVTARSPYAPLVPLPPLFRESGPIWVSAAVAFPITVKTAIPGAIATPTAAPTPTLTPTPTASVTEPAAPTVGTPEVVETVTPTAPESASTPTPIPPGTIPTATPTETQPPS